ncbi:TIM barrel protein [Algoriphagus sp. CAU 1675]|uniref:sugar phosphate isomerase/epimerase family protein n=1 Tax=Algoriphagus sp. CAU 1675 TaxID=3032597 RepID=UPI0023DA3BB5|nr:TIM barrel protein [Algoriphagus sp. CAU 1675]MDF2157096.1 TIM barrel protein [Algoriphagus sp. CAU 1675]
MNLSEKHFRPTVSRRDFLKSSSASALALAFPFSMIPDFLRDIPMGVVVHSYGARWGSKAGSTKYPAFQDAIDMMEHCKSIGAGGIQVMVNGWETDFAKKVRDARENLGLYLEGSISMPKSRDDVTRFEKEVKAAKEAGATVLRTVCLNGRRYENFASAGEFQGFKSRALESIHLAESIVRKHQVRLAIENHKDWKAKELAELIQNLGSEWVGVTLDFGNNVSLLEDPDEVIEVLAPYSFSTHVKDMGVKQNTEGFLLSEVPLGEGIVDLKRGVELCKKHNSQITFSLEMITRDPLEVPCLTEKYWATFGDFQATDLAKKLDYIRSKESKKDLPKVQGLNSEERLAFEEENVVACLEYSKANLLS